MDNRSMSPSHEKARGRPIDKDTATSTIVLRGLTSTTTDRDGEIEVRNTVIRLSYSNAKEKRDEEIRDALDEARVSYLDVRVIKDKTTVALSLSYSNLFAGISKGFGFVDFASVHEARRWMDYQKGLFRVRRYEIRLMYSTPRNQLDSLIHHPADAPGLLGPSSFMVRPPSLSEVSTGDWICSRCSSHNFRRRDQCYKCQLPRSQVQSLTNSVDGVDLIGTTPCNSKSIIYSFLTTIMATLKTEGSYNAQLNSSRNLALDLAHAAMAAQNNNNISPDTVAMNAVAASALLSQTSNNGAAVAQAAIQQKQTEQHVLSALTKSLRNHTEHTVSSQYAPSMAALVATGQQLPPPSFPFNAATASSTTYPFPDTSKYIYDESTRFYYDPVTGLMYEPNSKYFYDRASQQYHYWDQTKSTYLPVPQPGATDNSTSGSQADASDASKNKDDRGKTAQQIAREMEKWAKKMNAQKKSSSNTTQRTDSTSVSFYFRIFKYSVSEASRTADTGYAILEASASSVLGNDMRTPESTSLVAEYGGVEDSDDSGQEESLVIYCHFSFRLLDWAKLACMLCARGFKDAATLQKHRAFSALHYENLNKLRDKYGLPPIPAPTPGQSQDNANSANAASKNPLSIASLMQIGAQTASNHAKTVASKQTTGRPTTSGQYRDRAKERREKYGIPSPPRMKSTDSHSPTVQVEPEPFVLPIPLPPQSGKNVY
ncbi:unnamed protein product [Trichobilharzia regenti]|nr:unnamed protein product [Trichobilharzia regenti]